MLMSKAEKAFLNNPERRALQRHYEAPFLTRFGADVSGARVLEVGCGSFGSLGCRDRFVADPTAFTSKVT